MKNKPIVGLVMKSLDADFFKTMQAGAKNYAARNKHFELIAVGTKNQTDVQEQIDLVVELIKKKVDAIVVIPIDSKALVPIVVKAIQSGIKVVNIDIELDQKLLEEAGVQLAFLGPDNETAARMAGDVLAKRLRPGGKVVLINGIPEADNAQKRRKGFLASVEQNGLEFLGEGVGFWETEKARKAFADLLQKFPDLEGVMCGNDAMAMGVIDELKSKGLGRTIKVVGFDNDPSSRKLIKEGKLLATIDAYGSEMAVQGIKQALQALAGKENVGWLKSKITLITT